MSRTNEIMDDTSGFTNTQHDDNCLPHDNWAVAESALQAWEKLRFSLFN